MGITLKKFSLEEKLSSNQNYKNRGMFLENIINKTNVYNKKYNLCVVDKKPTPIKITAVKNHVVHGFFMEKTTTDYCGCWNGKYIDFEAKETKSKTSFAFGNIPVHQIEHCQCIINSGGICFFILYFSSFNEFYFIDASKIITLLELGNRSIKLSVIKECGFQLECDYIKGLNYVKILSNYY